MVKRKTTARCPPKFHRGTDGVCHKYKAAKKTTPRKGAAAKKKPAKKTTPRKSAAKKKTTPRKRKVQYYTISGQAWLPEMGEIKMQNLGSVHLPEAQAAVEAAPVSAAPAEMPKVMPAPEVAPVVQMPQVEIANVEVAPNMPAQVFEKSDEDKKKEADAELILKQKKELAEVKKDYDQLMNWVKMTNEKNRLEEAARKAPLPAPISRRMSTNEATPNPAPEPAAVSVPTPAVEGPTVTPAAVVTDFNLPNPKSQTVEERRAFFKIFEKQRQAFILNNSWMSIIDYLDGYEQSFEGSADLMDDKTRHEAVRMLTAYFLQFYRLYTEKKDKAIQKAGSKENLIAIFKRFDKFWDETVADTSLETDLFELSIDDPKQLSKNIQSTLNDLQQR